jgi:hypothetical protein
MRGGVWQTTSVPDAGAIQRHSQTQASAANVIRSSRPMRDMSCWAASVETAIGNCEQSSAD